MMWLIPRSNPGALTEYWRPNADGVSVERGALLPYGAYPRLFMLWMYAECARAEQLPPEQINPMTSSNDFMSEIGLDAMEVPVLFEQAYRLFASRFRAGDRVMPVIKESVLRRAHATMRASNPALHHSSDPASHHSKELAYGAAVPPGDGRTVLPAMHAHAPRAASLPRRARRLSVGRVLRGARVPRGPGALAPGGVPRARRAPLAIPERHRGPRVRARPGHASPEAPEPRGASASSACRRPFPSMSQARCVSPARLGTGGSRLRAPTRIGVPRQRLARSCRGKRGFSPDSSKT